MSTIEARAARRPVTIGGRTMSTVDGPPTLDARQLLLASSTASDDRGPRFWFERGPAGQLRKSETRSALQEEMVPAQTFPVRPTRVPVATATAGGCPLLKPGAQADALFWSEASVEKFVFPFYAIMGGLLPEPEYQEFLDDLSWAWYHFPASVQVRALAHIASVQANGVVDLHETVGVLFSQDGGEVRMLQLGEFCRAFRALGDGPLSTPKDGTGTVAQVFGATLDSVTLRKVADWASGIRDVLLTFHVDAAGRVRTVDPSTPVPAGVTVVQTYTPSIRADRGALGPVLVEPEGAVGNDLEHEADAVFWSEGAVEQFLLPYYASKCGRYAARELLHILLSFNGRADMGPVTVSVPSASASSADTDPVWPTYAAIHLPRSDYLAETETIPELRLLAAHLEEKVVRRLTVSEALKGTWAG